MNNQKVTMEAGGRFGQMFATALHKKDMSLREVAALVGYTYEQMRKIFLGTSTPSQLLLKELCRLLDMSLKEAAQATTADRMEKKYGKVGYEVSGRDPRVGDIEKVLPQLTDAEWGMFMSQIRGFVHDKRKNS